MTSCPSDDRITQFIEGTLSGEALAELEAHLDGCAECEPRLVSLARQRTREGGGAVSGGLLARGALVGRFVIIDALGSGAMGTVYAAFDPQLERPVALKILTGGNRAWALSEGRVLAQVTHPNVVAVFDAGVHEGLPFIAMERVQGEPLSAWLSRRPPAGAVVRAFRQAGAGLAAVHRVGLVHGDFKASNVLFGAAGRLRVADFGLSRKQSDERPSGGTWSLLSPEQRAGGPATVATDQYAFGRALQLGLEGARGRAPRHVTQALARATAERPEARFPSLEALCAALEDRRPARGVLGVAAGLVLALGGWLSWRPSPEQRCAQTTSPLAWSEAERSALRARFASLTAPWAPDTLRQTEHALDAWASAWRALEVDNCVAAARPRVLEREAVALREGCLELRRAELQSVVTGLQLATPAELLRAQAVAEGLTPVMGCADATRLSAAAPLPEAQQAEAAALDQALVEARVARDLGRLQVAREQLERLWPRAQALGHPPHVATVAFRLGSLLSRFNEHAQARALLERAVTEGVGSGVVDDAARAAVLLVYEAGVEAHQPEVARAWGAVGEALVKRRGLTDDVRGGLALNEALAEEAAGRWPEARARFDAALEALGHDVPGGHALGNALLNRARAGYEHGETGDLEAMAARALGLMAAHRGPRHPNLGVAHVLLGSLALDRGALPAAGEHVATALELARGAFGERHQETAMALDFSARVALAEGDVRGALPQAQQAVATLRALGAEGALAQATLTLAAAQLAQGDAPGALVTLAPVDAAHLMESDLCRAEGVRARANVALHQETRAQACGALQACAQRATVTGRELQAWCRASPSPGGPPAR
jgi:tetratricopeptide (TPR) repeat protein